MVKYNYFHLRSIIGTMTWVVVVDFVTNLIDDWG